jgi:hypothetical protein
MRFSNSLFCLPADILKMILSISADDYLLVFDLFEVIFLSILGGSCIFCYFCLFKVSFKTFCSVCSVPQVFLCYLMAYLLAAFNFILVFFFSSIFSLLGRGRGLVFGLKVHYYNYFFYFSILFWKFYSFFFSCLRINKSYIVIYPSCILRLDLWVWR